MKSKVTKEKVLQKHKNIATGLFIAMLLLYITAVYCGTKFDLPFIGYIKAFSEAAMVGALADWFAVTALFRYPLGIKIPHTNIIQNSKNAIGDNLGKFVVDNFLNATTIKPYIQKLMITNLVVSWLQKPNNQSIIAKEVKKIAAELLGKINNDEVVRYIEQQGTSLLAAADINSMASQAIKYFVAKEEYDKGLEQVLQKAIHLISKNENLVQEKVKENNYFFIPGFVNNKIAAKISQGIIDFLEDLKNDKHHPTRLEIKNYLLQLATDIKDTTKWKEAFQAFKEQIVKDSAINKYANAIWMHVKSNLEALMREDHTLFEEKVTRFINDTVQKLDNDPERKNTIDNWIQAKAYYYVLKNTQNVVTLISNTIAKWDAKELSDKLELEVGKDLQFIRINGTIVGGLMGIVIYTITQLFI